MADGKLASGYYIGKITGQRFGASGEKKTPYFEVDVTVDKRKTNQGMDTEDIPPIPTSVSIWLTPNYMQKGSGLECLKEIGFEGSDIANLNPEKTGYQNLAGNTVTLKFDSTVEWGWSIATLNGPRKPKTNVASVAISAAESLNHLLRAPGEAAPAAGPAEVNDDDEPF